MRVIDFSRARERIELKRALEQLRQVLLRAGIQPINMSAGEEEALAIRDRCQKEIDALCALPPELVQ